MPKLKVWPAPPSVMSFNLHLFIQEIKHLPVDSLEDCHNSSLMVQIEWRGSGRTGLLLKGFKKNCTSKRQIQGSGIVCWNEGFDHTCKFKRMNSDSYRAWIVNLEIQEIDQNRRGKIPIAGKAKVDVAEFALPENKKSIKVPINCNIRGHAAEAVLMIKLQFAELETSGSTAFTLPRALSLRSLSCTRSPQTYTTRFQNPKTGLGRSDTSDSSSGGKPEFHYGKLGMTNFLLVGQFPGKLDGNQDLKEIHLQQSPDQAKQQEQPSLVRLLSRNKTNLSFKAVSNSRGPPLLNKASEDGGDDIDNYHRHQPSIQLSKLSRETKVQPDESSQPSGFEDENRFEVGNWEKKRIASRDGQMELVTNIFFASIDQRSEKAAGGSACTVLATFIAHWLHENPKTLPLRCQFDELVREGSSEWRKLCENENHKEKFSDQHFDLETVLESKVRPLSVVTEMSYIGFFSLNDNADSFEFLQGAMSFDSIWNELVSIDATEERVYIGSWNDHFFVLKVGSDVIYLVDTLGERLSEGCNQAHILKFDKESAVYIQGTEPCYQTEDSNECKENEVDGDHNSSLKAFCEGMGSCKEYIKRFLAALPVRELQHDIERGLVEEATLHRRLQIEFHYTAPCNMR